MASWVQRPGQNYKLAPDFLVRQCVWFGYGLWSIQRKHRSYASTCLTVTFDPITLTWFGCSAISDTFSVISGNLQISEVPSGLLHKFIKKCRFTSDQLVVFCNHLQQLLAIYGNLGCLFLIVDVLWLLPEHNNQNLRSLSQSSTKLCINFVF